MTPSYRLRKVPLTPQWIKAAQRLDRQTFHTDAPFDFKETQHLWLAFFGPSPVAFLVASPAPDQSLCIDRVGVRSTHRGHGLQKRLMGMCKRGSKRLGLKRLFSYTMSNPHSDLNFCKMNFRVFKTEIYAAKHVLFWWELIL